MNPTNAEELNATLRQRNIARDKERIMNHLRSGTYMGLPIDFNNADEFIVAAYALGLAGVPLQARDTDVEKAAMVRAMFELNFERQQGYKP